MTTTMLINPKVQFFDSSGAPLDGGKVYTYAPGTTTPKASYTDSTGGTANANPVVLDARGEASIWLDGSYKIKLTDGADPETEIWTVDNVATLAGAIDPANLSSAVPVAKGGTGRTSATAGNLLLGNGTSAMTGLAPSTARKVCISDGTTWESRALEEADLPIAKATSAQVVAKTADKLIPADLLTMHPCVPKFVVRVSSAGAIVWRSDSGITSAKDSTGRYTVTLPDAFNATTDMVPFASVETTRPSTNKTAVWEIVDTTTIRVNIQQDATNAYDDNEFSLKVYGTLA